MSHFLHINGKNYELASSERVNDVRERIKSGIEKSARIEILVSFEGVATILNIEPVGVVAWSVFASPDDLEPKAKGRLLGVVEW